MSFPAAQARIGARPVRATPPQANMEKTMADLTPLPDTALGLYRHHKGGDYEVIGVARHSETHEPLVVYRPLYNNTGWWVRPHAMLFEDVMVDGTLRPRFEKIASRLRTSIGCD
jgi:hypothetical protein